MPENPLVALGRLGQSIWLDFITRRLVASGRLAGLIEGDGLRGMTSNPTIFEKAISGSEDYDEDIRRLAADGATPARIFEKLAVTDVRSACDLFRPLYDATGGADGLVSLEVNPELAHDTEGTAAEAARLWSAVDRPNAMIKIPGTRAGLGAISGAIADGINVNVTLLFSVARYAEVIAAFQEGLDRRAASGQPVARIASVASFFVSRVDGQVDPRLDQRTPASSVRGRAAIANAAEAYGLFGRSLASPAWQRLAKLGARPQRPLWASTSTKDPAYPDTYYVDALIAPDTVNTLPPDTLDAYRDHGRPEVRLPAAQQDAPGVLRALREAGIDLDQVTAWLEDDGVAKFAASYRQLLAGIEAKAHALALG
ncbi:MAG: transaldolase [Gemmatimonadales bacterium]